MKPVHLMPYNDGLPPGKRSAVSQPYGFCLPAILAEESTARRCLLFIAELKPSVHFSLRATALELAFLRSPAHIRVCLLATTTQCALKLLD